MDSKTTFYPISIPEVSVAPELDWLIIETPPRYVPMMPNGLAYVYNILRGVGLKAQALDLNIIAYHIFHQDRVINKRGNITLDSGFVLPEDPWSNASTGQFGREDVAEYFWPLHEQVLDEVEKNKPAVVGVSLSGDNTRIAKRFIGEVRRRHPEVVIVVGGYICVRPEIGPYVFEDFDYMIMGDAEPSLPMLASALKAGERPMDLPGIISKYDSPDREKVTALWAFEQDLYGFPKYDWVEDLSIYKDHTGFGLVPFCTSRGCRWSRCTFCAERFAFRLRDPNRVVDEIQYFAERGFKNFHFNESDLNGDPDNLLAFCREVISRNLNVSFIGQLRIHRRSTRDFFGELKRAGVKRLRFGVDGWCRHTLKLQKKGYSMQMVEQNLRDCKESGIQTGVNIVLGVPGETQKDIDDSIENITRISPWIDIVESINTLNLTAGSEYYEYPEKFNIKFLGNNKDVFDKNLNMIPPDLWYSEEPFIDHQTRTRRMAKVCAALHHQGVNIGSFANKVIKRNMIILGGHVFEWRNRLSPPRQVKFIAEAGDYNVLRVDDYYIAFMRSLGKVALSKERLGDRTIWPYIVRGESEVEIEAEIESRQKSNFQSQGYYMRSIEGGGYVAIRRDIEGMDLGEDFLVRWDLAPAIIPGNSIEELSVRIGIKIPHTSESTENGMLKPWYRRVLSFARLGNHNPG